MAALPTSAQGRRPATGFVLIAVLVLLVVVTLLAAAVAAISERAVSGAQADVEDFQAELDIIGTRETLLFLLATQRQTVAGLTVDEQVVTHAGQALWAPSPDEDDPLPPPIPVGNEIAFDGTIHAGLAGTRFALQDAAGLFSVNWTPPRFRAGFLAALGAPPEAWPALEAKRLDYQDADDLYRLDGAEAPQYAAAGLPPPANRTILTPLELRRVMGWRELLAPLSDREILDRITTARAIGLNVNTANRSTLRMLPGIDETTIERVLAMRQQMPFMLAWEFRRSFVTALDEEDPLQLLPMGAGNLKLWNNARGPVRLIHWTLTPADEKGRPWRIDYELTLPRDDTLDSTPARTPATALLAPPVPAGD